MPRPIRFVAAWFAGLLVQLILLPSLIGYKGPPQTWTALLNWVGSAAFWSAVWLFGLLVVLALLFGRLAARIGLPGLLAGLLGGAVTGLCYLLFYVASLNLDRAEMLAHLGSGALLFLGALAIVGGFMGWFWDRVA